MAICILNNTQPTTLLKIEVSPSISVPNESVGTLPTRSQGPSLSWLLHFHHRRTCNQTLEQVLTLPGSIVLFLLRLCLLYIDENVVMDACNEFYFL